jgi:hypothetical protein
MDATKRWRCPIRKFLALALADDVFVHLKTPAAFDDRWMSSTTRSRVIEIHKDKRSLPILRKTEQNRISSTKIVSAMSSNALLQDICQQCGYTEPVTTYTFRRGFANKAEGEFTSIRGPCCTNLPL